MPASRTTPSPFAPARLGWSRPSDEAAVWKAISRSLDLAAAELTRSDVSGAVSIRAGRGHLVSAQFLYHCLTARYITAARTALGRRLRRRRVERSAYTAAFASARFYLDQREAPYIQGPHILPLLFQRPGDMLPLLERPASLSPEVA